MKTIEVHAYICQLEGEVGKWHHAYDALMVERNQLVNKVLNLESELAKANAVISETPKQNSATEIDTLASGSRNLNEAIEAMAAELDELRKHEVECDLAKARIKELEQQLKKEG